MERGRVIVEQTKTDLGCNNSNLLSFSPLLPLSLLPLYSGSRASSHSGFANARRQAPT